MNIKLSSVGIYKEDIPTWKRWCKTLGLSSFELIRKMIEESKNRRMQEFYKTLPPRVEKIDKPLMLKRIRESYRKKKGVQ